MRIDAIPTMTGRTVLSCAVCGEIFVTSHVVAVMIDSDDKQIGCVCDACTMLGQDMLQRKVKERADAFRAMAAWLDLEADLGVTMPTPAAWRRMRSMPIAAPGVVV